MGSQRANRMHHVKCIHCSLIRAYRTMMSMNSDYVCSAFLCGKFMALAHFHQSQLRILKPFIQARICSYRNETITRCMRNFQCCCFLNKPHTELFIGSSHMKSIQCAHLNDFTVEIQSFACIFGWISAYFGKKVYHPHASLGQFLSKSQLFHCNYSSTNAAFELASMQHGLV